MLQDVLNLGLAERVGFEPTLPCGKHAFQACAFSHSATSPALQSNYESIISIIASLQAGGSVATRLIRPIGETGRTVLALPRKNRANGSPGFLSKNVSRR